MNCKIHRSMKVFKLPTFLTIVSVLILLLSGCSSMKNRAFERKIDHELFQNGFEDHFTGLMIYDPVKGDTLLKKDADKFFTPASNTKIFTLYTALKILGDSLPILRYTAAGDTLYFSGMGNPANLHPYFRDSSAVRFLEGFNVLRYVPGEFGEGRFGPGWAWEDYDGSYSPERSSLPLIRSVM